MTGISPTSLGLAAPTVDPALEPAAVRHGDANAKQAYQVGLAFEQMLVDQLSQQLSATVSGSDGSSDGSASGSSDGLSGTDSSSNPYSQLLPQALGSGVMSAGGLGVAAQIASSIDPALRGKL